MKWKAGVVGAIVLALMIPAAYWIQTLKQVEDFGFLNAYAKPQEILRPSYRFSPFMDFNEPWRCWEVPSRALPPDKLMALMEPKFLKSLVLGGNFYQFRSSASGKMRTWVIIVMDIGVYEVWTPWPGKSLLADLVR